MPIPVVFDLDGTLIDSAPDIQATAATVLREEGAAPLDRALTVSFVGAGAPAFVDRMMAARGLDPARRDAILARFLALYEGATALTRPYPGAVEALDLLRGRGHRLGLCTNKPGRPTRRALEAVGLGAAFEAIVAGDTLTARKPDPAPLLACVERLGGGPAAFVGDGEVDAETAARAGVPFALFTEGYRRSPPDAIPARVRFSDFAALPDLIAALGRRPGGGRP